METSPILTARPEDMSFEQYRAIKRQQQKEIKNYLRGSLVFKAKMFAQKSKGLTAMRVRNNGTNKGRN